ncbi:MAG: FecR domain-containing protein [Chloroflexota bacterium]|nr:FecR domain-containing protein [Chloroflexota bacterium]
MSVKTTSQASAESNTLPAWDTPSASRWRENPEQMAWTLILSSFVIFMLLAISIPLSIGYAVRYATVPETALLKATLGTLLLYPSTKPSDPLAITSQLAGDDNLRKDNIAEGNVIVATAGATQGTLELSSAEGTDAEALGSIQLYADTKLEVLRIRRPYFQRSREPYQVRLRLDKGEARIFTNSGDQRPLRVEIETPHGIVQLNAGAYKVAVDATQTNISVSTGQATLLHAQEASITVQAGLRAWMTKAQLAQAPVPAEQNLIRNGSFTSSAVWTPAAIAENVPAGSVKFDVRDGRNVAYFLREVEDGAHNEVSIAQTIDKNVNVYDELRLRLDVKILFQSLPGAGDFSTEFPVRIELNYTSIYGQNLNWGWGFYYRNREGPNPNVPNGDQTRQARWVTYESPDLLDLLRNEGTPPARINSIRIYASGHDYRSMVSEVELLAR